MKPDKIKRAPVLIVGGGGHAAVVAEAARYTREVVGFLDDDPHAALPAQKLNRLGALSDITADFAPLFIVAIGDNTTRRQVHQQCLELTAGRMQAVDIIHPRAFVSLTSQWHGGTFAAPGAIVHSSAVIGAGVILNSASVVEHDCCIGAFSHIAPGAVLGGNVNTGEEAFIGLGARVLPGITIGARAIVGAGAVVTRDVSPGETVKGMPAR
ncbi:MAG TPA: acetyltransferase [Phycisphaeraceae bacterium]|nr:acetyltransferase [Phycisphaeraceae bacterium]